MYKRQVYLKLTALPRLANWIKGSLLIKEGWEVGRREEGRGRCRKEVGVRVRKGGEGKREGKGWGYQPA